MRVGVMLSGLVGFFAFEALRVYKRRTQGMRAIEDGRLLEHLAVVIVTGMTVAAVASLAIVGNATSAWVCFSAPTSANALFGRGSAVATVEDGARPMLRSRSEAVRHWLQTHFGFW
jgi:hypothetical protein